VICLDNGLYENNINPNNLLELVDEYREKPDFKAKKCLQIGVKPLGTKNSEWGSSAKSFTADALNDCYVHVLFQASANAMECIIFFLKEFQLFELKQIIYFFLY
jgi:hypothetical protein